MEAQRFPLQPDGFFDGDATAKYGIDLARIEQQDFTSPIPRHLLYGAGTKSDILRCNRRNLRPCGSIELGGRRYRQPPHWDLATLPRSECCCSKMAVMSA
jgi:hypothetical protein